MGSVILLSIIGTAVFMGFGVTSPIYSLYAESLQANYFMIGLLSTTRSLTVFLAGYFWGRQSDRMVKRKVFLAGRLAGAAGWTRAHHWTSLKGSDLGCTKLAQAILGWEATTWQIGIRNQAELPGRKGESYLR